MQRSDRATPLADSVETIVTGDIDSDRCRDLISLADRTATLSLTGRGFAPGAPFPASHAVPFLGGIVSAGQVFVVDPAP